MEPAVANTENLVKSPHEIVAEKLTPFKDKLNPTVVETLSKDKRTEKDYKIDRSENRYHPGLTHITESWQGGERVIRMYDERYQPSDQWDYHKSGDISVSQRVGEGVREEKIEMSVYTDGSLTQEIRCTTETATLAAIGTKPLMEGDFFKYAGSGPMSEIVMIRPDGSREVSRLWSETKSIGHDRNRKRMVSENNGQVSVGSGDFGIDINYMPPMTVVNPTAR